MLPPPNQYIQLLTAIREQEKRRQRDEDQEKLDRVLASDMPEADLRRWKNNKPPGSSDAQVQPPS
jgi:hypothetical protein